MRIVKMTMTKTNPHSGVLRKQQMGILVETQIFASPFNPHSFVEPSGGFVANEW